MTPFASIHPNCRQKGDEGGHSFHFALCSTGCTRLRVLLANGGIKGVWQGMHDGRTCIIPFYNIFRTNYIRHKHTVHSNIRHPYSTILSQIDKRVVIGALSHSAYVMLLHYWARPLHMPATSLKLTKSCELAKQMLAKAGKWCPLAVGSNN